MYQHKAHNFSINLISLMVDYLSNHQLNSTNPILTLCEFLAEFCIKMTLHQS